MNNQKNSIIDDHRNMLCFSKRVSEFQEKNLRTWPFIFFKDIEEVKVEWDFINESQEFYSGKVSFDITLKQPVDDESFQKSVDQLSLAAKMLFWSETEVTVNKDGTAWQMK